MPAAVNAACRYIEGAIRTAPGLGKGHGPLNHFHSTYTLPFSPWVARSVRIRECSELTVSGATSSNTSSSGQT